MSSKFDAQAEEVENFDKFRDNVNLEPNSNESSRSNLAPLDSQTKRAATGYFYAEGYEYIYFVTSTKLAEYKFIFKDGEIYAGDELRASSPSELIAVIKQIVASHRDKLLRHSEQIESYEKIYAGRKDYTEFIRRHALLKYEIRKFYNRISRLHEAISACASEQAALKKPLKRYIAEVAAAKSLVAECAARLDDIYTHIQNLKHDKINRNIYMLTMVSALLLPLNFITSFFGMNTNGLFLSEYPNATAIVSVLMGAVFVLLATGFWVYNKKQG